MGSNVMAERVDEVEGATATPVRVLESIVSGINSGDLESLMPLYESDAAFATQPGSAENGTGSNLTLRRGALDVEAPRGMGEVPNLAG